MSRRLVLVEWIDSHAGPGGWQALDELERNAEPLHCRSVGWLVSSANGMKVLASSISGERNENLRLFARGDIAIPDKAIVKITTLAPARRPVQKRTGRAR